MNYDAFSSKTQYAVTCPMRNGLITRSSFTCTKCVRVTANMLHQLMDGFVCQQSKEQRQSQRKRAQAHRTTLTLGMLIPGKSYYRDQSRNSRVSIETLNFARVRTFTCVIRVGSPARVRGEGGAITGRTRRHSRPMTGPHHHLRTST